MTLPEESPRGDSYAHSDPQAAKPSLEGPKLSSRPSALIAIVPILVVLVTFLFWYQTWFGRPLTDREMAEYLADISVPHKTQHALAQLGERMARGDVTVRRWYPQLLSMTQNKEPQLRLMAAWAMGQDNKSDEFHLALRRLVDDPEPLVRWNAALGLARFGDSSGAPQLLQMLQPYTLVAREAGTVKFRLKEQDIVRSGSVVARISKVDEAKPKDMLSPVAGEVTRLVSRDGASVTVGEPLAVLSPGEEQLWESLRALYVVGRPEDLEDVDRLTRSGPGLSERVRQQAQITAQAIRQRAAQGEKSGLQGRPNT